MSTIRTEEAADLELEDESRVQFANREYEQDIEAQKTSLIDQVGVGSLEAVEVQVGSRELSAHEIPDMGKRG